MRFALIVVAAVGCGEVHNTKPDSGGGVDGAIDGAVDGSPDSGPAAAPMVSTFTPTWGSMAGGTRVKITGSGFSVHGLTVKFGAQAATAAPVSDTELMVTTPPGPHAPVTITVTTDGGSVDAALRYRYLAPLYAADGRSATITGQLYMINPATAAATAIGPTHFAITGLALSPDGVMFASTINQANVAPPSLATIDPYSGMVTLVGPLKTAAGVAAGAPDLAFDGNKLVGWYKNTMLTIDTATGIVTNGTVQVNCGGCGLASVAPGVMVWSPHQTDQKLYTVDTSTGVAAAGPKLTISQGLNSMTMVGTTVYASVDATTTPNTTNLFTVDPVSGNMAMVGALPANIDAIEGIPAQPALAAPVITTTASEPAPPPMVRIAGRQLAVADLVARLGRDAGDRRAIPLAAVARSARVELVTEDGSSMIVDRDAPHLALVANHRGELKLVDTRDWKRVLGPIIAVR